MGCKGKLWGTLNQLLGRSWPAGRGFDAPARSAISTEKKKKNPVLI